jgi:hypothetical protein
MRIPIPLLIRGENPFQRVPSFTNCIHFAITLRGFFVRRNLTKKCQKTNVKTQNSKKN